MRVLVFEPQYVGHNLAYLVHLFKRLAEMGCEVHLATSREAAASEQFENHLGEMKDRFRLLALDVFHERPGARGISVNGPAGSFSMMTGLLQALSQVQPQHLYIPFGNPLAHWCGLPNPVTSYLKRGRIEAELVLLFGRYAYAHHDWRSKIKQRVALSLLERGPWERIHHILPHAVKVLSAHSKKLASKTRLLPDPVERSDKVAPAEARRILNIPQEGRYSALVGLVERRKGVYELLRAFQRALPALRDTDRLLLAGKATDQVRDWLNGEFAHLMARRRVVTVDKHLTAQELNAACCAGNLMCTPYPNHRYSASIVIRAASVGVPVLANAIGWMEQTIEQFGLGATCDTNDCESFARQLVKSLDESDHFQLSSMAQRFVAFHSSTNFSQHLTSRLAERLGGAVQQERMLTWAGVLENEFTPRAAVAA